MLIGYARTSTSNQKYSLEDQIEKLTSKGCEKIFSEEISSVSSNRPEFEKSLEFAREGDTLVVTTLSRFARSISDLWKNVEKLDTKGVAFQILDMNLDTSTPTGKLLLTMLGAVYQFEREILLERQLVGIAKAKREGKFKGRVPTAKRKSEDIQRLLQEGLKPKEVADKLGMGVASVYRYRCLPDL
ncbi:recombinase family protein [Paracoccaceae bacterium]|nr:recombinase family protein [Paracoccaceae bacterium]